MVCKLVLKDLLSNTPNSVFSLILIEADLILLFVVIANSPNLSPEFKSFIFFKTIILIDLVSE